MAEPEKDIPMDAKSEDEEESSASDSSGEKEEDAHPHHHNVGKRAVVNYWQKVESRSEPGEYFYFNLQSGETQWDVPEGYTAENIQNFPKEGEELPEAQTQGGEVIAQLPIDDSDPHILDLMNRPTFEIGNGYTIRSTLTTIDLTGNHLKKIEKLTGGILPHLEVLCLRNNYIEVIEGLEDLPALKKLDLYGNRIKKIDNIAHLVNLEYLDLSYNKIKRIRRLLPLVRLTELYLAGNRIEKIEGIQTLVNVEILELGSNKIRDIEGLETLTKLRDLWLGRNKITQIGGLDGQKDTLRRLSVQRNRLKNLEGLEILAENLVEFYVSENGLTTLDGVQVLHRLEILDAAHNFLTDIRTIAECQNLREFWANDCKISDWKVVDESLSKLKGLNTVYLERNPISSDPRYRPKVQSIVPWLIDLDAVPLRQAAQPFLKAPESS